MPDWPIWVWVVIAVVVIAIIVGIIIAVTRGGGDRKHERAEQLRSKAHENDSAIAARKKRTDELAARADAVRREALAETERAEALRAETARAEENAARASQEAELRDDEAHHSREKLDEIVADREETLRKAEALDPDDHRRDDHRADVDRGHVDRDHVDRDPDGSTRARRLDVDDHPDPGDRR